MSAALDTLLGKLDGVERDGGGFKTLCPCHAERTASLSVKDGELGVIAHCFGCGASAEQICEKLGISIAELFFAPRDNGASPQTNGRKRGWREPDATYEIRDEADELIATKYRADGQAGGKKRMWLMRDGHKGLGGMPVTSLPLYRAEDAAQWSDDSSVVFVEGEKCTDRLRNSQIKALGSACGAAVIPEDGRLKVMLRFAEIVLWPDNDEPGRKHARRIGERLLALGLPPDRLRWLDPSRVEALEAEGADAADLDADQLRDALDGAVAPFPREFPHEEEPEEKPAAKLRLPASDPGAQAKAFIETRYTFDGSCTLLFWGGLFYQWNRAFYEARVDADVRAAIGSFLTNEADLVTMIRSVKGGAKSTIVPPCSKHKNEILDALKTSDIYRLADALTPPQWLDGGQVSSDVIGVSNGLLDLSTGILIPSSPRFFNLNILAVAYDPAAKCLNWLRFLGELFPTNPGAIPLLQQMFGHLITSDMTLQKIFLIVGRPRSGKGTIARIIRALLGARSYADSNMTALAGSSFGFESTIGKKLLIVPDARLDRSQDAAAAKEMFLTISGGDNPEIARKFLRNYAGPSELRILLLANELFDLGGDVSGALPNRIVPIECLESFLGRENLGLFERDLLPELSGILNWAIDGWLLLQAAGQFVLDDDAQEVIRHLEGIHSGDFGEFVETVLIKDDSNTTKHPGTLIDKDTLFAEYRQWCKRNGRPAKNKEHFYRDMRAAGINASFRYDPETKTSRTLDGKKAKWWVRGYSINRNYTSGEGSNE